MMVKTRIAPSPTWWLHLGTARVALYNWLFAKQNNGQFVIRIEDTDRERSEQQYEEDILEGLRWLGLNPDNDVGQHNPVSPLDKWWQELQNYEDVEPKEFESKRRQMERLPLYWKFAYQLLEQGKAYFAWETSQELEAMRDEAKKAKKPFVYKKHQYSPEQLQEFKKQWRKPVLRFQIPDKEIIYEDLIKWEIRFDGKLISDIVILKSDGIPTFLFSNVIDDWFMGISHVIRGEDHVPNMPKQIPIYEALWWDVPKYGHLPLLLNKDKTKMSKRSQNMGLVLIKDFKKEGFLPQALINYFALLGWHPSWDKEFFSIQELLEEFSLDRVQSSNAIYDYERALWMNGEYIRMLSDEDFVKALQTYLLEYWDNERKKFIKEFDKSYWLKFAPFVKVRLQTLSQFAQYSKYFFKPQFPDEDILLNPKMKVSKQLLIDILPQIIELLQSIDSKDWELDTLKQKLLEFVKQKWLKNGQVLWPIRAILTGVKASPWAFEVLYVLGRQESLKRLQDFYNLYLQDDKS